MKKITLHVRRTLPSQVRNLGLQRLRKSGRAQAFADRKKALAKKRCRGRVREDS